MRIAKFVLLTLVITAAISWAQVTYPAYQSTQPVSGTFWQATQPVSIASMPSTPVTGTFWQATQPVSAASLPLPAGAATSAAQTTGNTSLANLDVALSTRLKPADTLTAVTTVGTITNPVTVTQTAGNSVSIGSATNKTLIMKTGSVTTTATTADQVVLTYTVTSGKTLYLEYLSVVPRLTAVSATASILGAWSLETPSGTKTFTMTATNPTTSVLTPIVIPFGEPLPIAAGVVVRVVTTPAATTSMLWIANVGGYEK